MSGSRTLPAAARLVVTLPLFAAGLATMLTTLGVSGILLAICAMVAGVVVVRSVAQSVGLDPFPFGLLLGAPAGVLVGIYFWANDAWNTVRDGLRLEPAAMVADTRKPDESNDPEAVAVDALRWACQQMDQPTPALRVRETEAQLCYTVRYPVETPPRELLEADPERVSEWDDGVWIPDPDCDEDVPIPEDHVIVVSTGLLSVLPNRELAAVLAHEAAHLRNDDLRLMNVLLLPVFWAEDLVDRSEVGSLTEPLNEVLKPAIGRALGRATAGVTDLGVVTFARGREYAADRAAALSTGEPAALASALERLDETTDDRPSTDLRAVAVANVLPTTRRDRSGPWASHPSTEDRIERLREIAAEQESR